MSNDVFNVTVEKTTMEESQMKNYEIKESTRERILDLFTEELNRRYYPYDTYEVGGILDESYEQKQDLFNLFSKHPNWDEDNLMIRFSSDYTREFNRRAISDFGNWLNNILLENKIIVNNPSTEEEKKEYDRVSQILKFIMNDIKEQFFNESMDENIKIMNELNPKFHLRNNMKSSKAIGKICKEEGWDKLHTSRLIPDSLTEREDDYNYEYAKMCDGINPIKITRHTAISLNPIDYLLMSNGTSWKSCHYIDVFNDNPGCYSAGTISYMLDSHSIVFYTVDADYEGEELFFQKKITRQMFGYNDEVFLQSRMYPQANDTGAEHIYDEYRAVMQKVIAECLDKPNLWVKSKEDVKEVVIHGKNAQCYPDWESNKSGSHCSISKLKMRPKEKALPKIIMGAQARCIECGNLFDIDNSITCCIGKVCCRCGYSYNEDDMYFIDGDWYCCDCCYYCEKCEEQTADGTEEVHMIARHIGRNITEYWCECCRDEYTHQCIHCDEIWKEEDMEETEDGDWYCPDCAIDYICICERCDGRYVYDDMEEIDEYYYCSDCAKQVREEMGEEEENDEDEE